MITTPAPKQLTVEAQSEESSLRELDLKDLPVTIAVAKEQLQTRDPQAAIGVKFKADTDLSQGLSGTLPVSRSNLQVLDACICRIAWKWPSGWIIRERQFPQLFRRFFPWW